MNAYEELLMAQHPSSCEDCGHRSDCSLHNGPVLPVGPCDCGKLPARRVVVLDLETGMWLPGSTSILGVEGVRLAASLLPGMSEDAIAKAYEDYMNDDKPSAAIDTEAQVNDHRDRPDTGAQIAASLRALANYFESGTIPAARYPELPLFHLLGTATAQEVLDFADRTGILPDVIGAPGEDIHTTAELSLGAIVLRVYHIEQAEGVAE